MCRHMRIFYRMNTGRSKPVQLARPDKKIMRSEQALSDRVGRKDYWIGFLNLIGVGSVRLILNKADRKRGRYKKRTTPTH